MVRRRGDDSCVQGQTAGRRLQGAGGAHGVAQHGFDGGNRNGPGPLPKNRLHRGRFGLVVGRGPRAVGADVIHLRRGQAAARQAVGNGPGHATRVGHGHVLGVGAQAVAQHLGVNPGAARQGPLPLLQNQKTAAFGRDEPFSPRRKRGAKLRGDGEEPVEAREHDPREDVHAAGQHQLRRAGAQPVAGEGTGVIPGRAGRGQHDIGPAGRIRRPAAPERSRECRAPGGTFRGRPPSGTGPSRRSCWFPGGRAQGHPEPRQVERAKLQAGIGQACRAASRANWKASRGFFLDLGADAVR